MLDEFCEFTSSYYIQNSQIANGPLYLLIYSSKIKLGIKIVRVWSLKIQLSPPEVGALHLEKF